MNIFNRFWFVFKMEVAICTLEKKGFCRTIFGFVAVVEPFDVLHGNCKTMKGFDQE